VGGLGAIVNNAGDNTTALRLVTLGGDTTFGGVGRWDIRQSVTGGPNDALLDAAGAYKLTKVGINQVSIVGASVSATLDDVNVNQGIFSLETGSTLGNPAKTLTVAAGATFQLVSNAVPVDKICVFNGTGTNTTVNNFQGVNAISGAITLNSDVIVNVAPTQLTFSGAVGGTGNLIKSGSARLVLGGASSYSGTTTISNGLLVVGAAKSSGTGVNVTRGSALGGGSSISEAVTVNAGGIMPGNPATFSQTAQTLTINGTTTLNDSTNAFELGINPVFGSAQSDELQVNGNLTLSGTNTFRIVVLNYLTVGDTYTLVQYTGAGGLVDTNHIQIIPPFGYDFQLLNPAAPANTNKIQILVTKALGFDYWTAAVNGNWDVSTTANWLKNGLGSVFTNTDIANFLDVPTPSTTNVNIVGTVQPSGIFFTNFSLPYRFIGTGKISGSGGMFLAGGSPVYVENSGDNDFSGPITVDADNPDGGGLQAQLWIGNVLAGGSPSGSLGGGPMTNNAALIINRTGTLTLSNNIAGKGGLTNLGSGVVVLSGNSSYTGITLVNTGMVATASGTALGATNGPTIVANGAVLDVRGSALRGEMVFVSGAGADGSGAIVNNGVQQINALQYVTLQGNTTFNAGPGGTGGTNRWDIRGDGWLITDPPGSAYKLTKKGTAQFSLVGITNIDSALGDIDVLEGVFAVQTTTRQVGDPTKTITVSSNAQLNFFGLNSAPFNKVTVMLNGSTMWAESGTSTNVSPTSLQSGTVLFDCAGTLWMQSNTISGAASLLKLGGSSLFLATTNTYTGNTTISNGTIFLVGTANLTNSPIITFETTNANPVLDVSARVDQTLTLRSGQLVRGNGSIRGSLVVSAGATLTPGLSIGFMTITNAATLAGSTVMEINGTTVTNDQVRTTTVNYGGTLTVNNLGGTPSAGQSFRLFASSNYNSTFSSVSLPPLGPTVLLYWTNTLATDGRITVVSRPQPVTRNVVTTDGVNIIISGDSTNGTLSGNYYVLRSTNVTLPITQWTPIQTNAFGGGGTFNFSAPMTSPQLFYIIQLP
jgi:autotransporter-associated beta strand protein